MKTALWILLQVLALALLLGALPLAYLVGYSGVGWGAFLALLLLHLAELRITLPLARQKNLPTVIAVGKTMLFGFTWWVPLRQGLLKS